MSEHNVAPVPHDFRRQPKKNRAGSRLAEEQVDDPFQPDVGDRGEDGPRKVLAQKTAEGSGRRQSRRLLPGEMGAGEPGARRQEKMAGSLTANGEN
jgi:hypothetical protein